MTKLMLLPDKFLLKYPEKGINAMQTKLAIDVIIFAVCSVKRK